MITKDDGGTCQVILSLFPIVLSICGPLCVSYTIYLVLKIYLRIKKEILYNAIQIECHLFDNKYSFYYMRPNFSHMAVTARINHSWSLKP